MTEVASTKISSLLLMISTVDCTALLDGLQALFVVPTADKLDRAIQMSYFGLINSPGGLLTTATGGFKT